MQDIQHAHSPLTSFIIPCYNVPTALLRECIQSVLSLPLNDNEREIIIVDDGSDSSPINEIQEITERCLYIRQRNRGLPSARNAGLRIASGEYVQFIDGDDKLLPAAYAAVMDTARETDADVTMFRATARENATTKSAFKPKKGYTVTPGRTYMRDNNLRAAAWGYLFKRAIHDGLAFDESLLSHEDEDFTPRLLLRAERLCDTGMPAYYYRRRDGSIMSAADDSTKRGRLTNKEAVIMRLRTLAETVPDEDKPAIQRRTAQLTMDYLYDIIHYTHDSTALEEAVSRLRENGLFPLPDKRYTTKYVAFRMATASKMTRNLMLRML